MSNLLLFFFSIILSLNGWGQNQTLRGFAYDIATEEPIVLSNIRLTPEDSITHFASTNFDGFFSFNKLYPGQYHLEITYAGYDTLVRTTHFQRRHSRTQKAQRRFFKSDFTSIESAQPVAKGLTRVV